MFLLSRNSDQSKRHTWSYKGWFYFILSFEVYPGGVAGMSRPVPMWVKTIIIVISIKRNIYQLNRDVFFWAIESSFQSSVVVDCSMNYITIILPFARWKFWLDAIYGGHHSIKTSKQKLSYVLYVGQCRTRLSPHHYTRGHGLPEPGKDCILTMHRKEIATSYSSLITIQSGWRYLKQGTLQQKVPYSGLFSKGFYFWIFWRGLFLRK